MQPIIRRTLTITITERWIITWHDGQETVWQETHEVIRPVTREPDQLLPPSADDAVQDDDVLNLAPADLMEGDE